MGRETIAVARWRGSVAEVKALLESSQIILRGAIKARIDRTDISQIAIEGDDLVLRCHDEPLVLELGAAEAEKWRRTLLAPPPSLASKLGIGPDRPVFVLGTSDDPALAAALAGAMCATPAEAHQLGAIITSEADLAAALVVARQHAGLAVWCIYQKGKSAGFGDSQIRQMMRDHGYIDSKSCAVSDQLTATRYGRRKPA